MKNSENGRMAGLLVKNTNKGEDEWVDKLIKKKEKYKKSKMIKKVFIFSLLGLFGTGYSQAQVTGKTIKWKVESVMDIVKGAPAAQLGDVITRPDKIEVLPSPTALSKGTQTYTITKATSTWTDLSQDGSIVFQVADGDKKGTVAIKRINGKVWITVSIFQQGARAIFDFKCTGYEIISQ
jgi:hypothetical protein